MGKVHNPLVNAARIPPDKGVGAENDLRRILDSLLEGVQILDFNWNYVYVNKTFASYEETAIEDLTGHSILKRYPGIERTELFGALEECMHDRKSSQREVEFACSKGLRKWFQLTIEPVDEGIMVLFLDISKRKEADEKMRRSNQLYLFISQVNQKIVRVKGQATLFANACSMALEFGKFDAAWIGLFDDGDPQKILIVDHSGISDEDIREFVDSMPEFSFPQEQVLRSGEHYICNDILGDPEMQAWRPYALQHGIRSCIVLPIRKSGKIVGTYNLYASDLDFSSQEETALLLEVTSDISFALDLFEKDRLLTEHAQERRRAEDKLILNNEELMKTNLELDRFVYSASHDLRAPLSSLLGLIYLIELTSKETEILAYTKLMRTSINRLDSFLHNILRYSKNNRLELEVTYVSLTKTIQEVVDSLRHSKEAEGVIFKMDVDEQRPFYSDVYRLTIIIENLVSNAIKFQDHGRRERMIVITANTDQDNLNLEVTDNGIGIAPEYQPKIFDMFFRISGEREGSGIGLYIVKETVVKLQGAISVHSNEHTGTTFQVKLKNLKP